MMHARRGRVKARTREPIVFNELFTTPADILDPAMKSRDFDIDTLVVLEALESGVVPGDEHVAQLERMGLVERCDAGLALTFDARLKLANLRSILRD
jgi:hypothetical protein